MCMCVQSFQKLTAGAPCRSVPELLFADAIALLLVAIFSFGNLVGGVMLSTRFFGHGQVGTLAYIHACMVRA